MKRFLQSTVALIIFGKFVFVQISAAPNDGAIVENELRAANTVGEFEQCVESSKKAYTAARAANAASSNGSKNI